MGGDQHPTRFLTRGTSPNSLASSSPCLLPTRSLQASCFNPQTHTVRVQVPPHGEPKTTFSSYNSDTVSGGRMLTQCTKTKSSYFRQELMPREEKNKFLAFHFSHIWSRADFTYAGQHLDLVGKVRTGSNLMDILHATQMLRGMRGRKKNIHTI